jgi:thermitase
VRRSSTRQPRPGPRSRRPQFEAFALQVEAPRRTAPRSVARTVVRQVLGTGWRVRPVREGTGEFEAVRRRGRVSPAAAWDGAHALRARDEVVFAEPQFCMDVRDLHEPPSGRGRKASGGGDGHDPLTDHDYAWNLAALRVPQAWARFGRRRPGVHAIVGHPDTGYTPHPDVFDPNRLLVNLGYDVADGDRDPLDELEGGLLKHPGHGTGTASVIFSDGARPSAPPLVSGVAPGAALVPIRTTTSVVLWSMRNLAEAIRRAVAAGAHVISMSLGGPVRSTLLQNEIGAAAAQGVIVLAAAGNYVKFVVFPAAFEDVIAVAASNVRDRTWSGSSRGPTVDVTAPGESVWRAETKRTSAGYNFAVARGNGTSFAVAATAGVAALWLSYHGRQALISKYGRAHLATVFKHLLEATCRRPRGWDAANYGRGIVDADALLAHPLPDTVPARKARGGRRRVVSDDPTGINTILHLAPDAPRTGVERAVAALLGVHENDLPDVLADVGDEVAFHLAVRPDLLEELRRAAGRAAGGRARRATVAPLRRTFGRAGLSRTLARRMTS